MILNLLVPALILGVLDAQTANTTEGELSRVQENQTFITSTADYSTVRPGNLTSSSYEDEKHHIENELLNQTVHVITEDEENFQDQMELSHQHCLQEQLVKYSHEICGADFHMEMMLISTEKWCELDNIIRPYNNMALCLEELSGLLNCYYPNPNIQDFFIETHSTYFHNCSSELPLVDAPQELVITLTLIPVCLIPVLVYLVVWKSKVQE
ncbi:receptor activity-modifying protein 2 [Halichoeres trimaculatus]|uniref:receptor activity-modifying protein 2 n=1 Tax=Halichoeres trimaculatus TaxID=147232 RepID=UPI003D9DF771